MFEEGKGGLTLFGNVYEIPDGLVIICASMTLLPLVFSFYDGGGPCGAWVEY